MTKRLPTHGDRNEDRRHRTAPRGVPVEIPDDITGQYEGEELREYRSRRDTHVRIARLEDHKDHAIAMFSAVDAKLGMLVSHAETAEKYRQDREKREHDAEEHDKTRRWVIGVIAAIATAIVTVLEAVR